MTKFKRIASQAILGIGAIPLLVACGGPTAGPIEQPPGVEAPSGQSPVEPETTPPKPPEGAGAQPGGGSADPQVKVVADPEDLAVLVNKAISLPANYVPSDLVEPNVPFIFSEHDEKRLMRKEAAQALERMFAAAQQDGIHLAGVSGYRSYTTQEWLFQYWVGVQGEETARMYSAEPGHSEHQTGLAMDISGMTGECAADDCFAGTPEAIWLAQHGAEYGFIIRYPKGKESITGYNYEPWHLRYVGTAIAAEVSAQGITLEEYFGVAQ